MRTSALNISFKAQKGLTISAVKEEVQMLTLLGVTMVSTWAWPN